ncbi:MAG: alpha/beta fold hydrolase [Bacillota bacterium]|nr:alpha/beta fold hydrolase [Bacillota bacterium]
MKKILKITAISLLILGLVFLIGFTIFVGKSFFDGFTNASPREETKKNMAYFQEDYDKFKADHDIKELEIQSSKFDHKIALIHVDEGNEDLAVLIHGLGTSKESMAKQAQVFLDLGFDVIMYDQRNAGDNMADYSTFGVLESYDALDVLSYARENVGQGEILLFGESYGGATALIGAARDARNIDYMVLDSPLGDGMYMMEDTLAKIEKDTGLPQEFMVFAANIYTKMKLDFTLDDINSAEWIKDKNFDFPVLIINSQEDQVTPPAMVKEIYDNLKTDKKEIHTEESGGHANLIKEDYEKFKGIIEGFLEKYR